MGVYCNYYNHLALRQLPDGLHRDAPVESIQGDTARREGEPRLITQTNLRSHMECVICRAVTNLTNQYSQKPRAPNGRWAMPNANQAT